MAPEPSVLDNIEPQPLVSCTGCGFAWHGETAAHGLSVVGHCTRCGGALRFRSDETTAVEPVAETIEVTRTADAQQPWQVLGRPHWGR